MFAHCFIICTFKKSFELIEYILIPMDMYHLSRDSKSMTRKVYNWNSRIYAWEYYDKNVYTKTV